MNDISNNQQGNGHDPDDHQVIEIAAARKARQEQERQNKPRPPHEPLINLPPATKYMLGLFVLIHLFVTFGLSAPDRYMLFHYIGFVPGYYSGQLDAFGWEPLAGPLFYMFFHGGWVHLILNGVMLMAFGTAAERFIGAKRMIILFYLCSLIALIPHFLLYMDSVNPVIGASGGLSGLFAAALLIIQARGGMSLGRYGLWPLIAIWVLISVFFGMAGGPDGSPVAWSAHIGGFLAGILLYKPVLKYIR